MSCPKCGAAYTAIAAGSDFTVGLKKDGTPVAADSNRKGQCDSALLIP